MVDSCNSLLVILTVNCGEFLRHSLSNLTVECGEFHQGLGLRKWDSEFLQHILRNFDSS